MENIKSAEDEVQALKAQMNILIKQNGTKVTDDLLKLSIKLDKALNQCSWYKYSSAPEKKGNA